MTFEVDDPNGTFLALPKERQNAIVDDAFYNEVKKMPVTEFRRQFPQYNDLNDEALVRALQTRFGRQPDTLTDVAKSGGSGLLRGAAGYVGMGGDISKGLGASLEPGGVAANALEQQGVNVPQARQQAVASMPSWLRRFHETPTTTIGSSEVAGAIDTAAGAPVTKYKPQTTEGKYAGTAGEFLGNPLSYLGPGGFPLKAGIAAASGVGSEAAGQAFEGKPAEPYMRVLGAMGGAMTPAAVARAVTPFPATAARQRLVDALRGEGVTSLTAGQRTNSPALRYAESALGDAPGAGGKTSAITQRGQEQFTEAALRRAGAAGEATPEVLAANQQRLSDQFRDLSARNTLTADRQFLNDVAGARRVYDRVPQSQQRAMVDGYIDDINDHIRRTGSIPGPEYQEMRSRLSKQSNSLRNSDPTFSESLRDLRNALDNAMGRSISPADREAWNTARRQWGAQKVINKTASRAGEATAEGQLVPANLRNTVAAENRDAYATGRGPFNELARAGAGVMGPMPQSGTAPRAALHAIASALGAAVGGAGGMGPGTAAGALAGAVAGPAVAGRALMSRPVQAYLGNQVATPLLNNLSPRRAAILNALIAAQANQQRATR